MDNCHCQPVYDGKARKIGWGERYRDTKVIYVTMTLNCVNYDIMIVHLLHVTLIFVLQQTSSVQPAHSSSQLASKPRPDDKLVCVYHSNLKLLSELCAQCSDCDYFLDVFDGVGQLLLVKAT